MKCISKGLLRLSEKMELVLYRFEDCISVMLAKFLLLLILPNIVVAVQR